VSATSRFPSKLALGLTRVGGQLYQAPPCANAEGLIGRLQNLDACMGGTAETTLNFTVLKLVAIRPSSQSSISCKPSPAQSLSALPSDTSRASKL
jgi:hypothetical protein